MITEYAPAQQHILSIKILHINIIQYVLYNTDERLFLYSMSVRPSERITGGFQAGGNNNNNKVSDEKTAIACIQQTMSTCDPHFCEKFYQAGTKTM